MGFRFRRSVKLLPGVRLNLGLRGASLSVGGKGLTTNLSGRGIRSTIGIPGTGLTYTTSSSSGRRRGSAGPSRRQLEAAARRRAVEARRDAALAEVEAEEAALDDVLDSWRDAPEIPDASVYEAATRSSPFKFEEAPPGELDPDRELRNVRREVRARAVEGHPFPWATLAVAVLVAGAAVALGTLAAPLAGLGASLDLVLWAAVVVPGVAAPTGFIVRSLGARRARVEVDRMRRLDSVWPDRWREIQTAHLRTVHAWEKRRETAREAHEAVDSDRATWAKRLVEGDLVAIEESVADSLSDVDFPFEALCRVAIPDAGSAYVLLDLPEVEDVLPETRTKVLKDGTKKEVKRAKGDRMTAYARLACGLAFLVSRVAFEAGPTIQNVMIGAYTQRRQKRSGEVDDDFVYEVTVSRDRSVALDHEEMDPVAELQRLPSRIKQNASGDFAKVPAPTWAM